MSEELKVAFGDLEVGQEFTCEGEDRIYEKVTRTMAAASDGDYYFRAGELVEVYS